MKNKTRTTFKNDFEAEIYAGLSSVPKRLNSKYLYDARGDALFQQIMALPEYYLSDLEFDILLENRNRLADLFEADDGFDLIEFGAGDGKKTKILLNHLQNRQVDFKYCPVDISENAVCDLCESLRILLPKLRVEPHVGTYSQVLDKLADYRERKKVILFLGSNIGNFTPDAAVWFLQKLRSSMGDQDRLLVGFDQKKHPQKILDAYHDTAGVTEAFNKNILRRLNRELGAQFDINSFVYWPVYDPEQGVMRSYLLSKSAQTVPIEALNLDVVFEPWESIHVENSRKFDAPSIQQFAERAGLMVSEVFSDANTHFKNYIFRKSLTV